MLNFGCYRSLCYGIYLLYMYSYMACDENEQCSEIKV